MVLPLKNPILTQTQKKEEKTKENVDFPLLSLYSRIGIFTRFLLYIIICAFIMCTRNLQRYWECPSTDPVQSLTVLKAFSGDTLLYTYTYIIYGFEFLFKYNM